MLRRIVECVPNFSEGRNPETLDEIASAIRRIPGVLLLGQEQDHDHHRAVITFVGNPQAVLDAAIAAAHVATKRIDLRTHQGVHPRIGALDVLPFIPVQGVTLAECAQLARRAARELWQQCRIPCYLYEAAALRPERKNLADIRRGGFETLVREVQSHPERQPDVGGPHLHPSAGAVAVGARKFLIAWNVLLNTSDVGPARQIASLIRQSSGGFPFVKALGLELPSRGLTQVSMNLLDFEETPMQPVFDAICAQASHLGIEVIGSELIGFVPRRAIELNAEHSLRMVNFHRGSVLENRIDELSEARATNQTQTFANGTAQAAIQEALRLLDGAQQWANQALAGHHGAGHKGTAPLGRPLEATQGIQALRTEADQLYHAQSTRAQLSNAGQVGGRKQSPAEFAVALAEHCVAVKTRIVAGMPSPISDPQQGVATQPAPHSAVMASDTNQSVGLPGGLQGAQTQQGEQTETSDLPGPLHPRATLDAAKQLVQCARRFALLAAELSLHDEPPTAAQHSTVKPDLQALRSRIGALRELDGNEQAE